MTTSLLDRPTDRCLAAAAPPYTGCSAFVVDDEIRHAYGCPGRDGRDDDMEEGE